MKRVVVLVAIAGCNQVFDLAPTRSIDAQPPSDIDGDGVADTNDNCLTLANSDQANSDGDGFGDACDTCPQLASTSVHDEDRDHIGDDCDLCPGTPDFGVDRDLDGVGDLCDPVPNKPAQLDHRVSFEPFVTMPASWQAAGATWTQAADTIAPDNVLEVSDPGLRQTAITSGAATWMATIGLAAKTAWDGSDSYGIIAASPSDSVSCIVRCATSEMGTSCIGTVQHNNFTNATTLVVPQPTVQIGIRVKDFGAATCIFGTALEINAGVFPTDGMQISVLASPRVRVTYFDYVE